MRILRQLALAGLVAAAAPAPADLAGDWVGTYTCAQGLTALDLSMKAVGDGRVDAVFHFRPDASNPRVPEGCYQMTGEASASPQTFVLRPTRWLLRPDGYVSVGLTGRLSQDAIDGDVDYYGCSVFHLVRRVVPLRRPLVCAGSGLISAL